MTSERVELDLVLKRLADLEKMTKLLNDSTRSADVLIQKFATMDNRIKQLADSTKRVQVSLAEASGGRSLAQTGAMLARGNPTSFLRNSQVTGEIKDFEAQLENVVARVTNRFARGMNEVVKAAQNSEILKMAKTRQDTPLGDLRGVQAQIQAQNFRIAKEQLEMEKLVGAARDAKNVKLLKEKAALEALLPVERQLLAIEKQRAAGVNLQNATAANLAKANDPAYMASVRKMSEQRVLGDSGASLFKIQGQLLVNYMLMNKVFQLFSFGTSFVLELDKAFYDLQAVTDTTDTEMIGLRETLIKVSETTKFTAVEVAKAATTMGQAGFSSEQIKQSIEGVTLFATAVGSDLQSAVDVATSTISVFNLNASEMGRVANILTGAVNLSKLTVDKLALGIQYAGNAAATAGITLEEFVSVLGAAANTGIKAGSTLGTGLRQVIVSLQSPTKRFKEELQKVGLTLSDVDVQTRGIIPVLETLNKAGFTSANAFRSLELRGAAMLIALMRSTDQMLEMEEALALSDAAATANERQMKSLANTMDRFKSILGTFIVQLTGPLVTALKDTIDVFGGLLSIIGKIPYALSILGTAFVSVLGGAILVKVFQLGANLLMVKGTIEAVGIAAAASTGRIAAMTAALGALMRNPVFLAAGAIAIIIGLSNAFKDAATSVDEARAAFDEANGKFNETRTRIDSVESELNRLIQRYPELKNNQRAVNTEVLNLQERFSEFGTALDKPINTIDDLISALKELRGELNEIALTEAEIAVNRQVDVLNTQIRTKLANEYGPTGADLLASGVNMGPVFSSRPYAKDSAYGKFEGRSMGDLGPDERKELEELLKAELRNKSRSLEARKTTLEFLRDLQKFDVASRRVVEGYVRNSDFAKEEFDKIKIIEQSIVEKQAELNKAKGADRQKKKAELDSLKEQVLEIQARASDPQNVQAIVDELGVYSYEEVSKANNAIILQETVKMINQLGDVDREMKEDLAESTIDFYDKYTELNKLKIEQLKRAMDRVASQFESESKKLGSVIESNRDPRSAGYGKYSDADISKMENKQYALETAALDARLKKTQLLLPALKELEGHQETLMNQAKEAYDASVASGTNDNRSEKALKSYVEAVRDYNSAENERYQLEQQISEMQGELQARVGESTEAHMGLVDAIGFSIQEYVKAMEVQESFGGNIKKNVYGTLDAARSGFKDFVKDVATGTESVGGAFRKMANRIIEAMLDIAAQQAASGLFGLFGSLFQSVIGGFGPGATSASAPIQGLGQITVTDLPPLTANGGGYVHRYAGGGGVPGRDSINARLRPGEYVLRNSAVEMIGRSNLDAINAAGNSRASRSLGDVATVASAANDNKETILNVYVVAPDFKPPLTKNDVLATIQEDVYKGGQTAKLIKSIVVGKS